MKRLSPGLLALLFCLISIFALMTMLHMQGNARVINYTGIVRGATQQLVKQEMNGFPNDTLTAHLDGIVSELSTGEGENDLVALPDEAYQALIQQLQQEWGELKEEIVRVREGRPSRQLYVLSESYFDLANRAVSAAERYSEKCVTKSICVLLFLSGGFVVLFVLLRVSEARQKKAKLALDMAENASRAKSEFLSRISHEIRTPMNGITGMTAIARRFVDDPEKMTDCLDKIDLSASYLLSLLNDVLDMSKIESGKIQLDEQPFDVTELLNRIQGMFWRKAEDSGVTLRMRCDGLPVTQVIGDNLRISQVLVNLVSNAMKFTPPGGSVTLEARQTAEDKETVCLEFTVADTGIGISEAFQQHIFEPFEQAQPATARQYGGTGLGLAISSSFVKLMGGTIDVHSKLGEGTQFVVSLTLRRNLAGAAGGPQTDAKGIVCDFTGVRILLAEDNAINAEIATLLLEDVGAKVDHAENGKAAVDLFSMSPEGTFSAILMDVQMPVMDGLKATRTIRALHRPDAGQIPVIGLSANAFQEDRKKAREHGMNAYLSKPLDPDRLYQTLGQVIHRETA
ncbi:ATP-binding protein [Clostridium sp. D33t1_170424_F3]|uniref:ATP-binding protein n=1 Tax=Clostridium sp. D33t1_170424_F3 TaxID=2787099 RepID=UPI002570C513|nr:ATP-binding protein [Clostridium sp. D33t1_170424_F3]